MLPSVLPYHGNFISNQGKLIKLLHLEKESEFMSMKRHSTGKRKEKGNGKSSSSFFMPLFH